jgi:hypothetical protein
MSTHTVLPKSAERRAPSARRSGWRRWLLSGAPSHAYATWTLFAVYLVATACALWDIFQPRG